MILISLVTLVTLTGATTETTDFDVYHPMRTLHYLVKTTMPGGGNFANKLSPGYVYVWNGVKPRCDLKDMWNQLLYDEKIFTDEHLKEHNDPKPDVSKLYLREGKFKNGEDEILETVTQNGRKLIREAIMNRVRMGHDLCQFFTVKSKDGADVIPPPDDGVTRVNRQSLINAKTLMNPLNHFEIALNASKKEETRKEKPWFMEQVAKNANKAKIRTHPWKAKAYHHRHYVDRDCDTLLYLMPSYVDCIDGKYTETVIDCDGRNDCKRDDEDEDVEYLTGVKYDGAAPISKLYRGLHKMTRLKKEPFFLVADSFHLNKDIHENFNSYWVNPIRAQQEPVFQGFPIFASKQFPISFQRSWTFHGETYIWAQPSRWPKPTSVFSKSNWITMDNGKTRTEKIYKPNIPRNIQNNNNFATNFPYPYRNLTIRQGVKTPILSPMFMGNILNWKATEAMSDNLLAVRDWSPRNVIKATGTLNPYWEGHKVNKNLYNVLNMNGRPLWRSQATDPLYISNAQFAKRVKNQYLAWNRPYTAFDVSEGTKYIDNYKRTNIEGVSVNRIVPKTNGPQDWLSRTNSGKSFVYAYSAGCWMKLAPENYGYDVPAQYANSVSEEKWQIYENEHKERADQGLEPKYKLNKALERWWKGDYGEKWYFSLKDAITQKRCNGDEMLWYLFYSRPSKMDEFCTNTNFGNNIVEDFCKLNPPVYFNFTVTNVNNRKVENRGKTFSYRPEWHKEKFGNDFIFTGFASKNNPDVWMTVEERQAEFEQWCTDNGRDCTGIDMVNKNDKTGAAAITSTTTLLTNILFLIVLFL